MSLNIGELVAYISVNSSKGEAAVSNFTKKMQSAGDSAASKFQRVGQSVTGVGDNIYGVGGQLTKGITAPVGIAVGAVGGLTAALGWGRLKSVDTAQAQLRGLGYDTEDVERITGQLTTALEGGMLTMGEATSAAASGMASGVKEGKELTRYIKVLDGAVAGSNGTFDEMNQIFARVQGNGKLMTNELDMIEQRMPGFTATMAEGFGVSQEEMRKMVSNGEVSADDFMNVMEGFAGDMATEYAKSWEGMVQNTKAYIGIIGESLLGGVFEQSKDSIAEFIEWMKSDEVQAWAAEAGQAIGSAFSKILSAVKTVVTWFGNLPGPVQKAALVIGGIAVAAGPVLMIVGKLISVFGGMISTIGTVIGWLSKLGPVLTIVKTGITLVSGAMKALWLTMMANPIILIIAAVAALVAGLIWFFTQTETGKQIWSNFMDWLASAWEWIKTTAVSVFQGTVDAIVGAWTWIKDKTTEIWDTIVNWVKDNWQAILDWLSLLNPVTAVIRHWDKIKAATAAAWEWVTTKLKEVWDGIITWITDSVTKVWNKVKDGWNKIKSTTTAVWNLVKAAITNAFVKIVSAVMTKVRIVRDKIQNAWNRAKAITVNAFNGIKTAVSNGINGAVNFVRNLPGRALSALGNIGSKLYNSGWSMIDGFRRGIVNAFSNAVNAVKNGLSRIRNFFPFSPAKEGPFSGKGYTSYSGAALVEGFADGMRAKESEIVRQAEAITKAAALSMPDTDLGGSSSAVGRGASAQAGGVTNNFYTYNPVEEPTSETARKASAYIGVSI
ncbi:MAG: phage tail protein [Brevibacterium linens]